VEIRLLGPVEVANGGRPVAIGGPKERAVLTALALQANRAVPSDELAEALWGDEQPRTAERTLRVYVSRLRQTFGEGPPSLLTRPGGYELRATAADLDVLAVEDEVRAARAAVDAGDLEQAGARFAAAEARWSGPSVGEFADAAFARAEAARLDELRRAIAEERIDVELSRGQHAEMVGDLEARCAANPLRERLWSQLMLALYRSGRQAEALRAYQELRGHLVEELGLEPTPDVRALEQLIVAQSPDLDWKGSAPGRRTDLPSGDVTFLFTDIEGSTRLMRRLGEAAYGEILEQHRRLVRGALARHDGVEVRTEGDAFFVVFASAPDAVAAAVDAQVALRQHTWPPGDEPLVRMGLLSGAATPLDGDYVAMVVHQAARIAATGHGGQIVIGGTTANAVRRALPDGATVRELGAYRLKDFDLPVTLHQVSHPGLLSDFPALRAPSALNQTMPALKTSFVGRDAEAAAVRNLLEDTQLVTITGVGGAGKTRLALRVAGELETRYPDGVWLVELERVHDTAQVAAAVAAALGAREEGERPLVESIIDRLTGQSLLLVLDNSEHVLRGVGVLLQRLMAACPGMHVLATSREPIGVAGEQAWALPPMGIPEPDNTSVAGLLDVDTVRLFTARASLVRANFELTAENAAAVGELCRRVEGLPLAVELAAARTKALTPQKIVERLTNRFDVLAGDGAVQTAARGRHATLRATIDWSHDLLGDNERALFRRLSVFVGGASLEAVEAVGAGDGLSKDAVLDVLSSLLDKSLVSFEERLGEPRYRMLDTIREYAAEHLDVTGESDAVRDRHRDLFRSSMRKATLELHGSNAPYWLARIELELGNIDAAVDRAEATGDREGLAYLAEGLSHFYEIRGRNSDGRVVLDRARQQLGGDDIERVAIVARMAKLAANQGDLAAADTLFREAIESARRHNKIDDLTGSLTGLAAVRMFQSDFDEARSFAEEALRICEEEGVDTNAGNARSTLGGVAWTTGDLATARAQFETLYAELRANVDDLWSVNSALANLVGVTIDGGDFNAALPRAHELLVSARALGDEDTAGTALFYIAICEGRAGNHEAAAGFFEEAREIFERLGSTMVLPSVLCGLGEIRLAQGNAAVASQLCASAVALASGTQNTFACIQALALLGGTLAESDPASAIRLVIAARTMVAAAGAQGFDAAIEEEDRVLARARELLGDAAADAATEAGEALGYDDAVTLVGDLNLA
jgi:predicted ATPase/DNA-binding SARP family transcriptional activator